MKNRHVFALALVASILLAGCTALPGQGGGDEEDEAETRYRITQNDGLSVSFQSLQPTYFDDGPITLDLSLQNTGQASADDIKAKLYGASFLAGIGISPARRTLQGVDKAAQQAGGIATATQTFQADNHSVNLRQGQTQSFPAGVRVMYDYSTNASASFSVVPRRDFTGGSALVTTDNTAGPVKASIKVQSPKPVSASGSGGTVTVSIPIQVRNVGGGQVVSGIDGSRGDVGLNVGFPRASSSTASITGCSPSSFQFPRGASQRRVVCTAEISQDVFDTQLTLQADLDYTYFETQETSFSIEGTAN
ncbi:MAG: hypothetical protein ABEI97_00670 [Candidatus Nanohaloarchaea archaeon]